MPDLPRPPQTYRTFTERFPGLAQAWEALGAASRDGPLGERELRLVKLAVAIGAMREGAVHSNVRKALALGVTRAEIEQVVASSASTLGLPATVAVYTWVDDCLDDETGGPRR